MSNKYNTKTFTEVWEKQSDFLKDYNENGIPVIVSEDNIKTLYYLLYARYGNNPIANRDENQFKYKVWSIIFQYGPTWEKKLDIQSKLRGLTEQELMQGSKQILNHSYNPNSDPTEQSTEELDYISDQNTTNFKRSRIEGYRVLWEELKVDVSENFINQFKKLFKPFVRSENPVTYDDEGYCNEEGEIIKWNNR